MPIVKITVLLLITGLSSITAFAELPKAYRVYEIGRELAKTGSLAHLQETLKDFESPSITYVDTKDTSEESDDETVVVKLSDGASLTDEQFIAFSEFGEGKRLTTTPRAVAHCSEDDNLDEGEDPICEQPTIALAKSLFWRPSALNNNGDILWNVQFLLCDYENHSVPDSTSNASEKKVLDTCSGEKVQRSFLSVMNEEYKTGLGNAYTNGDPQILNLTSYRQAPFDAVMESVTERDGLSMVNFSRNSSFSTGLNDNRSTVGFGAFEHISAINSSAVATGYGMMISSAENALPADLNAWLPTVEDYLGDTDDAYQFGFNPVDTQAPNFFSKYSSANSANSSISFISNDINNSNVVVGQLTFTETVNDSSVTASNRAVVVSARLADDPATTTIESMGFGCIPGPDADKTSIDSSALAISESNIVVGWITRQFEQSENISDEPYGAYAYFFPSTEDEAIDENNLVTLSAQPDSVVDSSTDVCQTGEDDIITIGDTHDLFVDNNSVSYDVSAGGVVVGALKDDENQWTIGFVANIDKSVSAKDEVSLQILDWQNKDSGNYSHVPTEESFDDKESSEAIAVNDSGLVVGYFKVKDYQLNPHGFVYDSQSDTPQMVDLNDRIACDQKFEIVSAVDINNDGWILADGIRNRDSLSNEPDEKAASSALLLVPISEAGVDYTNQDCDYSYRFDSGAPEKGGDSDGGGSIFWLTLLVLLPGIKKLCRFNHI